MLHQPPIMTSENVKMPPLIYGTAWKKERTADLVEQAILCGFRGIDTACQPKHYDEALVGEALRRVRNQGIMRDDLFVQTKFTPLAGQDPLRIPYDPKAPLELQVSQSFEASKRNLQTPFVDSLVLHSPLFPYSDLAKVWGAMETLYHAKGARQLGISNCYDLELLVRLYADAEVKPAVVQNRFYAESGYDALLRRWCDEKGIVYQSFWSLSANPHVLESSVLVSLGKKYGKTEAQLFFRYLSHKGIVPLIGSTSKVHMNEDLAIFEFELTPDEIETIDRVLAKFV